MTEEPEHVKALKKSLEKLDEPKNCRFCKTPDSVHYHGDDGTCHNCQKEIRKLENDHPLDRI
jgi:hypothetical protein